MNRSEELAFERCRAVLQSLGDRDKWVILSNLAYSASPLRQSDELDLVCLGPRGAIAIEVKHWDHAWIKEHQMQAASEAEKLTAKTRRMGGHVRMLVPGARIHVEQALLLTREQAAGGSKLEPIRGVPVLTMKSIADWFKQLRVGLLTPAQVDLLAKRLEPRAAIQLDARVRRIGDYQNLELASSKEDRFHRVFRGVHQRTKEKVVLHLYDLSASEEKDPRRLAEREFRTLQVLQKSRYVPRFRDSFQDLPEYPGELCFFTVFDPEAPSVSRRLSDVKWTLEQRLEFAVLALEALREVHGLTDEQSVTIVHRNLSPETVMVAARNRPLFTGFQLARLPVTQTLASGTLSGPVGSWVAPEVTSGGLAAATAASDVFSLGTTLSTLFQDDEPRLAASARALLEGACAAAPAERLALDELIEGLRALLPQGGAADESRASTRQLEQECPPAEFWCEGTEVPFRSMRLRIVARLGSGGVGRAFKVEHVDPESGENYGTYVAKVIRTQESGEAARRAYHRVRSHSVSPGLSTVFDVAERWEPDRVIVLLRWVDGESLADISGVLSIAAEDCGEESIESLLRRWLREVCTALAALHENGLVHGDVSPRNLIHYRGGLTLTDFDLVTSAGQPAWGTGARAYCSPEAERREPLVPSDDLYALAASLFEAAFDHSPFLQPNGSVDKSAGLHWHDEDRELVSGLVEFLGRATHSDRSQRFADARAALAWLDASTSALEGGRPAPVKTAEPTPTPARREQVVEWLDSLLRVYPGSPYGNVETRGLDSDFAVATYVPTPLEAELLDDIRARRVRLVVLCGNAGDGKTALLQRLAASFGVDRMSSATRVWEARTADGLLLRANLDGSAAWEGRSANELLDEFFAPFLDGQPADDRAHLLAINDGRLLEWLEGRVRSNGACLLTKALSAFLANDDDPDAAPAHVRFISLNHRSLVGGRQGEGEEVTTEFLDQLIDALLGGPQALGKWEPCRTCTAWERCTAGPTAHRLLASPDAAEGRRGRRLRERLAEALQAVHQRGEVHITTRELRGALSYVLFGVRFCRELHAQPERQAERPGDMAFDPSSPFRQGELLRELAELDPALEAHPYLDRWLTGHSARELPGAGPSYAWLKLDSARRRAFFEWTAEEIEAVAGTPDAIGLATGEHLQRFRSATLRSAAGNAELCAEVCRGISQLENLPQAALLRRRMVPLRIPSRTPTETVFWVEKPLERFRLEAELPFIRDPALPILPRRLKLIYRCTDGREEILAMGYALFHTLLCLAGGEQLSALRSDDLFANLQIFAQRVTQEDEAHLLAWHPKADDSVYRIGIRRREKHQVLACEPADLVTP